MVDKEFEKYAEDTVRYFTDTQFDAYMIGRNKEERIWENRILALHIFLMAFLVIYAVAWAASGNDVFIYMGAATMLTPALVTIVKTFI